MTKFICECLDGARKCTHETPGFSAPTLCCVRANATCHWRKAENQEVETPAPELPDWCKVGAWVWHNNSFDGLNFEQDYFKIESTDREYVYVNHFPVHYTYLKPARIRPWNDDDELKSKVGKVFDLGGSSLVLCTMYNKQDRALYFAGAEDAGYTAKMLMKCGCMSDGSPCGVLEHENEHGEWVE